MLVAYCVQGCREFGAHRMYVTPPLYTADFELGV